MTKLLLKLFVKNHNDVGNDLVRENYGKLSGIVGILLNLLLAVGKILVGTLFGLISVTADGLNNLTDCGSNLVSLISFKLSNKPADKEHPYGHARIEYVSSMIVAFIILVVAFELAKESIADMMTGSQPVSITIDRILETAAKKYSITPEDIRGTKRTKEIAYARHIAIYLLRKMTDMSLPQIGKLLKRDHSTIISSLKNVEKEMATNKQMAEDISDLMREIKG